jgi:hypothetical protein
MLTHKYDVANSRIQLTRSFVFLRHLCRPADANRQVPLNRFPTARLHNTAFATTISKRENRIRSQFPLSAFP